MRRPALFAALLCVTLAGCAPSQGQHIDDADITAEVKSRLVSAEGQRAADIKVDTVHGALQLSGFVDMQRAKRRAAQIANGVPGVNEVHNDIRVR